MVALEWKYQCSALHWINKEILFLTCTALLLSFRYCRAEPSIRRVWPTVVLAQCRMTSLVCRTGRHLCPGLTQVDRLFLWQLLTPTYISQPNLLSTLMLTILRSCSSVYLDIQNHRAIKCDIWLLFSSEPKRCHRWGYEYGAVSGHVARTGWRCGHLIITSIRK